MVMEEEGCGNLLFPGSHGPVCQHSLSAWENIPLLSWLLLRGRCSQCRTAIPLQVLLIELFTALFFGISAWSVPGIQALFSLWLLASFLLPLTLIDWQHQLLPDCLTQPLLWAGLLVHTLGHALPLRDAVLGAVAGYLSLWLIYWGFRLTTGREGLGYGDFKLLAALGAWLGWQALPHTLLLASASGLIWTLLQRLVTRRSLEQPLAFGPWLALAGGGIFLWGQV